MGTDEDEVFIVQRVEEAEGNPTRGNDSMFSQSNNKDEENMGTEEELQGRIRETAGQECQVTLGPRSEAML